MSIFSKLILPSTVIVRTNAESLLADVRSQDFSRKPVADGEVLNLNHPAFIYGHLAIYPGMILEILNVPEKRARAPQYFYDLFSKDSLCLDDPDGTIYPEMSEIVTAFRQSYDVLIDQMPAISEEVLLEPTPGERIARFPIKGAFLVHLVTSHLGLHLGQMSAWRRAMRLAAAK